MWKHIIHKIIFIYNVHSAQGANFNLVIMKIEWSWEAVTEPEYLSGPGYTGPVKYPLPSHFIPRPFSLRPSSSSNWWFLNFALVPESHYAKIENPPLSEKLIFITFRGYENHPRSISFDQCPVWEIEETLRFRKILSQEFWIWFVPQKTIIRSLIPYFFSRRIEVPRVVVAQLLNLQRYVWKFVIGRMICSLQPNGYCKFENFRLKR